MLKNRFQKFIEKNYHGKEPYNIKEEDKEKHTEIQIFC